MRADPQAAQLLPRPHHLLPLLLLFLHSTNAEVVCESASTCTFPSTYQTHLNCSGFQQCVNKQINCDDDHDCTIQCWGDRSCEANTVVNCPRRANCLVQCLGNQACSDASTRVICPNTLPAGKTCVVQCGTGDSACQNNFVTGNTAMVHCFSDATVCSPGNNMMINPNLGTGGAPVRTDQCAQNTIGSSPTCAQCSNHPELDKGMGVCNNHHSSVTSNSLSICTCICRNQWATLPGENATKGQCNYCPPQYDSIAGDCGVCAAGYFNYPLCEPCNNANNCNGRSDGEPMVAGNQCVCKCLNSWEGDRCQTCPVEYDETTNCDDCSNARNYYGTYPSCRRCTNAEFCSSRATMEPSPSGRDCLCDCYGGWLRPHCDVCPAKYDRTPATPTGLGCDRCNTASNYYGTFPNCFLCTANDYCQGRASQANVVLGKCVCVCLDQWEGEFCDKCPERYEQTTCAACNNQLNYYGTYPSCRKCTNDDYCTGNSKTAPVIQGSSCICDCMNFFEGEFCDRCPVFATGALCDRCATGFYPAGNTCVRCVFPDANLYCNQRATAATEVMGRCVCSCVDQWEGDTCTTCPVQYNPSTCSSCNVNGNYYPKPTYPTCVSCTNDGYCKGRAVGSPTATPSQERCQCTCRNQWTSALNRGDCDTCPLQFQGGSDCNACSQGFYSYPFCIACNFAADASMYCSNRATGMEIRGNECFCTGCINSWTGKRCDVCPERYLNSTNCDGCNTAGNYFGTYPDCIPCTNADYCNNRATTSPTALNGVCRCNCKNQFTGDRCETCPAQFGGQECQICAAGYFGYPNCIRCAWGSAETRAYCNGRGTNVIATGNTCQCACQNRWTGDRCTICPSMYDQTTCSRCNAQQNYFGDFPDCVPCTNVDYCNSRSTSDPIAVNGRCVCSCQGRWSGDRCLDCPIQYTGGQCDACAISRNYYPAPAFPICKACTNEDFCSNHGRLDMPPRVEKGRCVCNCRDQWRGDNCEICPVQYAATSNRQCPVPNACFGDCDMCNTTAGYFQWPPLSTTLNCIECTNAAWCNGNALFEPVRDFFMNVPTCKCECKDGYTGDRCDKCADGYYGFPNCGQCEWGWAKANYCNQRNSVDVRLREGNCSCVCINEYSGPRCDFCPKQYTQDSQSYCGACNIAEGYYGVYPACYECTNVKYCNGRSLTTPKATPSLGLCECKCRPPWEGEFCHICPPNWQTDIHGNSCSQCSPGYYGPQCKPCSISAMSFCNDHGDTVFLDGDKCKCNCKDGWTGDACDTCPIQYSRATGCRSCATGYFGVYPTCLPDCSIQGFCSGRAIHAEPQGNLCACVCRNGYRGLNCEICPPQFGGDDCEKCADGFLGTPPNCNADCTVEKFCNNAAYATFPNNRHGCTCYCRNGWTGDSCNVCPQPYSGSDCDVCPSPQVGWPPRCANQCTVEVSCSNHAISVVQTIDRKCDCTCRNQYKGNSCEYCPPMYAGDCDQCAMGFVGLYPKCEALCANEAHCNGHAFGLSPARNTADPFDDTCVCWCRNGWSGDRCNQCPGQFSGDDCDLCPKGLVGTPPYCSMQCSDAFNCLGRSQAPVEPYKDSNGVDRCRCSCREPWRGTSCQFSGIFTEGRPVYVDEDDDLNTTSLVALAIASIIAVLCCALAIFCHKTNYIGSYAEKLAEEGKAVVLE